MTLVPVTGGSITVGIDVAPTGCNPNTPSGDTWADRFVLAPVLPSAFVVNPQGGVDGNQALATSAELTGTDPQTVVYTLNPRAVWSDGVPITAADFRYAWLEQRGNTTAAADVLGYRDISSVIGSNHGKTVTVVFTTPFADWRMLFANLLPAHVLARTGWDPTCTTVDPAIDLSGGPYEIHAVGPTQVALVANPRWWGASTSVTHLDVRVARDSAQLGSWATDGQAQVVQPSSFDADLLDRLSGSPTVSSTVKQSSTFLQLEFSTTGPITATTAVRLAVAHAVDRQALVDSTVGWADAGIVPATSHLWSQVEGPFAQPATPAALPNALDDGNQSDTTTTTGPPTAATPFPTGASPAETARLLTAAGDTIDAAGQWVGLDGTPLTLRLVWDAGDGWSSATVAPLVRQLTRAGFTVQPRAEPTSTAAGQALADGTADLALLPMTSTGYDSQAVNWYTDMLGPAGVDGSQNWTNFDSPQLDALLDQAVRQLNPVTGATSYQMADQLLWTDMVALPLFTEPLVVGTSDRVNGVGPNPYGAGLLWYPQAWQVQALQPVGATTTTAP
jgi:peptide/nickel transport system substrate-binding protein